MAHTDPTERRLQLLALGYHIIPNKMKIPAVPGWNTPEWLAKEMTPARVKGWAKRFPGADTTGVRIENGLVVIDVDVDDVLVDQLWAEIGYIAPSVFARSPVRYGASAYKVALFCYLSGEAWTRVASRKYNGHQVEIFGGLPTNKGNASRQFGVYGPHSEGTNYDWFAGVPAQLHEIAPQDLPTLSKDQAYAIVAAFERLAEAAGWAAEAAADQDGAAVVYDIDDDTRFDTNRGGTGITYGELCDEYAAYGELRCSSNFMAGRGDSGSRERCLVGDANRHKCVAVWVPSDEALHFPADLAPGAAIDELADTLREAGIKPPDVDRPKGAALEDFHAFLPLHQFVFMPTRELWPASSVDDILPRIQLFDANGAAVMRGPKKDKPVWLKPSQWLGQYRPLEQMTWMPGEAPIIRDRLVADGGWIARQGSRCLNLYRPPTIAHGDANAAETWISHVERLYGDEAMHVIKWLAHRVQFPSDKINHALVLGGAPGVGKDTLLEPVKHAIGPWNMAEIAPKDMLGRFNGYAKSVILRMSEARDLGDMTRYEFYERTKIYCAAPPDVIRVDEKNLREYAIPNVCGVVITTNYKTNGIYLPGDDRRHFVAWSELSKEDFKEAYWRDLWAWYASGGFGHVAAYLASIDLSDFDAKAPPPVTEAFRAIVAANMAPEDAEMADTLDRLGSPSAVTLLQIREKATSFEFERWLADRKNQRVIPFRFEQCGYARVHNPTAKSGLWVVKNIRQAIYARADLSLREQLMAAQKLAQDTAPAPNAPNALDFHPHHKNKK